jgi:hypothetical protein
VIDDSNSKSSFVSPSIVLNGTLEQVLSPCWSDLRVIIVTLQTHTLEVIKRSPNQSNQE